MAYAEKRGARTTGVWIAEVTLAGVKHRARFGTKTEGDRWEALSRALGQPAPTAKALDTRAAHPLGRMATEARRNREGWKASRDVSLDQRLADAVQLLGEDTDVGAIGALAVDEFVRKLEARRGRDGGALSPKTINRYLAVVSGVLRYSASRYGTPCPEFPWQPEAPGRLYVFQREQDAPITAILGEPMGLLYRVFAETALRPGELFGIEPGQIELEWLRLWETKTDRPRSIPIDARLSRPLRRLVEQAALPDPDDFYRALKRAVAALGLDADLTTYSLRHTGLTRLAQRGVAGPVLQKWAGHADYRTTQKYIHLADEDLKRAHAMLKAGDEHPDASVVTLG